MRAAAELIYEKGCIASSLTDIATAAGVPLDNVYHYFKTKEALAEALIDLRLAELREVLARAERNERPENRIKHFLGFRCEVGVGRHCGRAESITSEPVNLRYAAIPNSSAMKSA